jgi:hypothetical protein
VAGAAAAGGGRPTKCATFFLFFFNDSRGYGKVNVHNQTQVMSLLHAVTLFFFIKGPIVSPFFCSTACLRSFVRRSRTKIDPLPRDFFFTFFFGPEHKKDKADNK